MPVPALPVRFQSTLPCRSDRHQDYSATLYMDFNPRSLAGATRNNLLQYRVLKFQSTLPYGSDKRWDYLFGSKAISIHAPLRERLGFGLLLRNTLTHFNPRSLTGATFKAITLHINTLNFNPRSLTGATQISSGCQSNHSYFNPRSLAGATDCSCLLIFRRIHFNPRSLAGATQRQRNYHHQRRYFNPRSLAGATLMLAVVLVILKFQSTLPCGSDNSTALHLA